MMAGDKTLHLPTIKPLAEISREVIDLALAADTDGARNALDKLRVMRCRLARAVQNRKLSVAKKLEDEMGVLLAGDEEQSLPAEMNELDLLLYRQQVDQFNQSMDTIREWLSSSMEPFSLEDLLSSRQGVDLLLDNILPEIWDFTQDIIVLTGHEAPDLHPALVDRGQQRFVVITDDSGLSDLNAESKGWLESLESEASSTVLWNVDSPVDRDCAQLLSGEEVPQVTLMGHQLSDLHQEGFGEVCKLLSQATIGMRSLKEWPVIFVEQWLGQLSNMTKFRSASDLQPAFANKHVLVASPGPSLFDSLPMLKSAREIFTVIAPLRSLETLLDNDISPDYVVHVDATDFSRVLPKQHSIGAISLICFDHSHPSVWGAKFKQVYTLPDPHLIGSKLVHALHGDNIPILPGGSVSVVAAELAAALNAASVTLVGQDLSISRGQYVADIGSNAAQDPDSNGQLEQVLTCKGINGERLRTQEDYLWFIGEFEQLSSRCRHRMPLYNSTVHGAFLEGWEHVSLDQHPEVSRLAGEDISDQQGHTDPHLEATRYQRCDEGISQALREERGLARKVADLSDELGKMCQALAEAGGNDVSDIERLEAEMMSLLSAPGSLLHFYTSRQTLALSAAVASVDSLPDNLRVSAEYYQQMVSRSHKLSRLLLNAAEEIESTIMQKEGLDDR